MRLVFMISALVAAALGVSASTSPRPLFRDVAAESGLEFHQLTGASGEYLMPEIMGSGGALFDYDNDGDLDVYLVQGSPLDTGKALRFPPASRTKPGNRLFRNMLVETGTLRFVDVSDKAGVAYSGVGMGVATGDYDNDGFLDLYVTNVGHNVLYHNNRDGTFADVTRQAGVDDERWSTSAAFLDYDGDGLLDLFVGNYVDFTPQSNKHCFAPTGEPDYCTPMAYKAVPSRLLHNDGHGRFSDVTGPSGVGASFGPALGVVAADFTGDGRPDIYVANDTAANRLWVNQGQGAFKESALEAGVAYNADGRTKAGMGVTAEEVDGQRTWMILVTNLTREGATLFRGTKGVFDDVSAAFGVTAATFPLTGFGTQWIDYDNDGRLDLAIANGAVTIVESQRGTPYPYAQRSQLFHGEDPGRPFREVSDFAGPAFLDGAVGRGMAVGDIDNDGKVDILLTNNNGPVRLLHNEVAGAGQWLEVRLDAAKGNRFGIGARVGVMRSGMDTIWRRVHTDSSYLSANDVRAHFGLGPGEEPVTVVVEWPDGSTERWNGVQPDRVVVFRQGSGSKN